MSQTAGIVLIGGPNKGTRFRPLSFKVPKPLFPIALKPMIHYPIQACIDHGIKTVFLIGSYAITDGCLQNFLDQSATAWPSARIVYLQEYISLGTAGALYHFRDRFLAFSRLLVFNGDVLCNNYPLHDMLSIPSDSVLLSTRCSQKMQHLGCLIIADNNKVAHFVEKPEDLLSTHVNCGIYLLNKVVIYQILSNKLLNNQGEAEEINYSLEKDVFPELVSKQVLSSVVLESLPGGTHWTQIKDPANTLFANKMILDQTKKSKIIHPTASIHETAVIGQNVTIGEGCVVEAGARIKDSIILPRSKIGKNSLVSNAILGWDSSVGDWSHIEGVVEKKIDPNHKFSINTASSDHSNYFTSDGSLKKLVTILGHNVAVKDEVLVYSSLILPGKTINSNVSRRIVL